MRAAAPCILCGHPHLAHEPCAGAASESTPARPSPPPFQAPEPEPPDEMLGQSLGNFRIVRMLGRGGMGTVYLGEHALIGSKVAIKFLHPHLVGERTLIERFVAEATSVNLIGHENIVSIFDLSMMPPNRWYLVMEYLDGQPLSSLAGAPMPPETAVSILSQACDALQAAHAANVIHRDLKPENVFLVRRGGAEHFVKLVDFGIAKLGAHKAGVTAAGLVVGTPEYMSPEQWQGEDIDGRADLYALGVIAYLLLTGRLPFREATPMGYYAAHRERVPEPPRSLVPEIPEALEAAVMRALAKRPEDRFQVAFEMRETLRRAIDPAMLRQLTPFPSPVRMPTPMPLGRQPSTPLPPDAAPPTPSPAPAASVAAPEPAAAPPAERPAPPRLPARVCGPGWPERTLPTADLTKAGLFVQASPPWPAVFARVKIALMHPQRELELAGDVVRHVDEDQAESWNLPGEGFVVQFVGLDAGQRDAVSRILGGRDLEAASGEIADDAKAAPVVDLWARRMNRDFYHLLGVEPNSERSEVRGRVRRATQDLQALLSRPLSAHQRKTVEAALERLEAVTGWFESTVKRAEYDASISNFRGVARCLTEGLSTAEMRALRAQFLAARPKAETGAKVRAVSGAALAKGGNDKGAVDEYEAALLLDPLNDEYHRMYWTLRRRLAKEGGGP